MGTLVKKPQDKEGLQAQKGFSILELTMTLGLMGILFALTTTIYVNVEHFMGRHTAIIEARNEGLLLLSEIRKNYQIDLIKEDDLPRKVSSKAQTVEGKISDKTGEAIQAVKTVINTVQTTSGASQVDLFTLTNDCIELPESMRNKVPMFDTAYFQEIFESVGISESYSSAPGLQSAAFSNLQVTCEEYLQNFQCGFNSVPYITYESMGRTMEVPSNISRPSRFKSAKNTAIAAFICDTETIEGDQRHFKDITIFLGTYDFIQRRNPNLKRRLKWQRFRTVMSLPSPSENVYYVRDPEP